MSTVSAVRSGGRPVLPACGRRRTCVALPRRHVEHRAQHGRLSGAHPGGHRGQGGPGRRGGRQLGFWMQPRRAPPTCWQASLPAVVWRPSVTFRLAAGCTCVPCCCPSWQHEPAPLYRLQKTASCGRASCITCGSAAQRCPGEPNMDPFLTATPSPVCRCTAGSGACLLPAWWAPSWACSSWRLCATRQRPVSGAAPWQGPPPPFCCLRSPASPCPWRRHGLPCCLLRPAPPHCVAMPRPDAAPCPALHSEPLVRRGAGPLTALLRQAGTCWAGGAPVLMLFPNAQITSRHRSLPCAQSASRQWRRARTRPRPPGSPPSLRRAWSACW